MVLEMIIGSLRHFGYRSDDDTIDRAHYFVTSNLLVCLSLLVSWKQFGGKPIECLTPPKFPGPWEDYAENYCWAQDTYFMPFDKQVPKSLTARENERISYYQWVPFFLLVQAAFFRLPSLIWKTLADHSGIRIHHIVRLAMDDRNMEPEYKKSTIKSLTTHLQGALRFHRRLFRKNIRPHKWLFFLNLPYCAFFVTFIYLVTKLLYLSNVMLQLYLLNKFLETDDEYMLYGLGAVMDIVNGTTWHTSGYFPRVTICDFQIRGDPANVQRYSVQCVLVINIFTEKIFVFLWFWYVTLMLFTLISFVYWLVVVILPCPSWWFVSRHLELSEMPFDPRASQGDVRRFVNKYVKTDGIFVLRMITSHAGIIFGTELVLSLWRSFYGIEEQVKRAASDEAKLYLTPTPTQEQEKENRFNFIRNLGGLRHRKKESKADKSNDMTVKLLPPPKTGGKEEEKRENEKTEGQSNPSAPLLHSTSVTVPQSYRDAMTVKVAGRRSTSVDDDHEIQTNDQP